MSKHVIVSTGPESLKSEGLREDPQPWEDGLRAEPKPGNFEWWYFDSHFEDGSTAVVTFFTKSLLDRRARLDPGVSVTITRPDGVKLSGLSQIRPGDFTASRERCYVRAGESWVRGDLCNYEMHVRVEDISVYLNFSGLVPAWRPGAGKLYFDESRAHYFAWFPAIPFGEVEGHLTYDGSIHTVKGSCYHDHNWGNVGLNDVLSSWYWGRAHLGDYTIIFADMRATPRYAHQHLPIFLLARGKEILTGDGRPLRVDEGEFIADPGGRSYPDHLDLYWEKGSESIRLRLKNPAMIDSFSLLDLLPPWQQFIGRILANPYYFRFNADLELQVNLGDMRAVEQGKALYEVMLLR